MGRRKLWLLVVAVVSLALASTGLSAVAYAEENKVVIVSWGGDYQAAMRKAYWKPFEKATGIKVVEDTRPLPPRIKAQVESGKVLWDIVDLTAGQYMEVAKIAGFEPIDYNMIDKASLAKIIKAGQKKDAIMHQMCSVGIAYLTDVFKGNPPRNWADFWNIKKFPGPRALGTPLGAGVYMSFEAALMADGVPMNKLYPLDIKRAFKKLDKIKPHVRKWYKTAAMPQQLLVDKEVVMATVFSARTFILKSKGAPIDFVWNQSSHFPMYLCIPKGAPHKKNAMKLINFMLKAQSQARYGNIYFYGVANTEAYKKIPLARAKAHTTYPPNFKKGFVQNANWWAQNAAKVNEMWNEWLLK